MATKTIDVEQIEKGKIYDKVFLTDGKAMLAKKNTVRKLGLNTVMVEMKDSKNTGKQYELIVGLEGDSKPIDLKDYQEVGQSVKMTGKQDYWEGKLEYDKQVTLLRQKREAATSESIARMKGHELAMTLAELNGGMLGPDQSLEIAAKFAKFYLTGEIDYQGLEMLKQKFKQEAKQ